MERNYDIELKSKSYDLACDLAGEVECAGTQMIEFEAKEEEEDNDDDDGRT